MYCNKLDEKLEKTPTKHRQKKKNYWHRNANAFAVFNITNTTGKLSLIQNYCSSFSHLQDSLVLYFADDLSPGGFVPGLTHDEVPQGGGILGSGLVLGDYLTEGVVWERGQGVSVPQWGCHRHWSVSRPQAHSSSTEAQPLNTGSLSGVSQSIMSRLQNEEKNQSLFISVISVNLHLLAENEAGLAPVNPAATGGRSEQQPPAWGADASHPADPAQLQQGFAAGFTASPYLILPLF